MGEVTEIVAPGGRYAVELHAIEMRMSHWLACASLWQRAPRRQLLSLGGDLWSADEVAWRPDGSCVSAWLRRYPGDAPAIQLEIYPERQIVVPRSTADAPVEFGELAAFLEQYYRLRRAGA